jgi:hypothetical protein
MFYPFALWDTKKGDKKKLLWESKNWFKKNFYPYFFSGVFLVIGLEFLQQTLSLPDSVSPHNSGGSSPLKSEIKNYWFW